MKEKSDKPQASAEGKSEKPQATPAAGGFEGEKMKQEDAQKKADTEEPSTDASKATAKEAQKTGKPMSEYSGFEGEKKLKIKLKQVMTIAGILHQPGEELELPEREALNLVGLGSAVELPGTAPAAKK